MDGPQHHPITPIIDRYGAVVLDGGIATELERRGLDLNDPLWSAKILIEQPAAIEQVHYDYLAAGADLVLSASYQATFEGFARRRIARSAAADLMRFSVRLVRDARDRFLAQYDDPAARPEPLVGASVGCYGAYLADGSEYRGDYDLSVRRLVEFHRPRLDVLVEAQPDLLAFETIPCAHEAEAVVRALEEHPAIPAMISFSCCDDAHVCHGEPLAVCVDIVNDARSCVAVGVNCTPPRHVVGLLRSLEGVTELPLVTYPNSGEIWDADTHRWMAAPDQIDFGESARAWYGAGARLIGGCCRTTPDTIRRIAAALRGGVSGEP